MSSSRTHDEEMRGKADEARRQIVVARLMEISIARPDSDFDGDSDLEDLI